VDPRVEIMLRDYDRCAQEILATLQRADAILGLGTTIFGAGVIYGVQEDVASLVLLSPIALLGLLLYSIRIYSIVNALGGHKSAIENRVNAIQGENILIWESHIVKPILINSKGANAVWSSLVVFTYLTTLYAAYYTYTNIGARAGGGYLILTIIISILLWRQWSDMNTIFDRAFELSASVLGNPL
jgi:hypothetical protein